MVATLIVNTLSSLFTKFEVTVGNNLASIIYTVSSIMVFFTNIAFSRIYVEEMDPTYGQFIRGFFIAILSYLSTQGLGVSVAVEGSDRERLRLFRCLIGATEVLFLFFCVKKIHVSDINIIQCLPPFFIAFFDHLMLKSKFHKSEMMLGVISFTGVIMILKPDWFGSQQSMGENVSLEGEQFQYATGVERIIWTVMLIAVLAFWSFGTVIIRKLNNVNSFALSIPYGIMLTIESSLMMIQAQTFKDLSWGLLLNACLVLGILGFVSQLLFTRSFQIGKPGRVGMFQNLFVPLGFIFETVYLNEFPSAVKLVGAVLVVGSSMKLVYDQTKRIEQGKSEDD